ncbi:MAG TPA: M28 family peptidase [Gemmatimonadaceae bacterium]|nr:M28 family peptidase [Gemmatimonadaceae bacterium]
MRNSARVTARFVALAHLTLPLAAIAQAPLPLKHAPKPTAPAITADDAMTRLYIFADDSMQGRRAGEPGGLKGTAYIESEVRRLGLTPAGDSGTFFQWVPLVSRAVTPGQTIKADDEPLLVGTDIVPTGLTGMPASIDGVQVIFAGDATDSGKSIPTEQGAGKIVLVTSNASSANARYPRAVAFVLVAPDPQFARFRTISSGRSIRLRTDADTMRTKFTLVTSVSNVKKFLGVALENARPGTLGRTIHGNINFAMNPAPARNVVAILKGSDPKLRSEYVAIGAHNDHLGIRRAGAVDHDSLRAYNEIAEKIFVARTGHGTEFPGSGLTPEEIASIHVNVDSLHRIRPARRDSIYNGADDDGSGSMGVLEIAEKYATAKVKPKRSMIFVWHTGEELGLYGSEWFTDHPTIPRDSIVAQLNIDMIGRGEASDLPGGGPRYVELIGSRRLSTELGDMVEAVSKSAGYNFNFDYAFDATGHPEQIYCRSDHYEYARYGIPITFITTGGHSDYHQLTDEPQYISYAHLASIANFVYDVATKIANLDHRVVVDKPKPDPHGQCVQ